MKVLKPPQSGSHDGITASRNRFGQYERTRAIPVNPGSTAQGLVRARMAANSAAWRELTAAQRAGWNGLGGSMARTDALGQTYTLQGNQAYASVNNNRVMCGLAVEADAPVLETPEAVLTATITLTPAAFSVAWTPTPMPADTFLAVYASPQRSPGRNYEKDLRLIKLTAAAGASPLAILTEYTAKFGVPVEGNKIFLSLVAIRFGFESGPLMTAAIVAGA